MKARLITFGLLIISSLFLSYMPNQIESDSIEKIITHKIEKIDKIKMENVLTPRTPIIIVKRD
jgi:uncharacterized protein YqgV (UPF0045/DUF77 family)